MKGIIFLICLVFPVSCYALTIGPTTISNCYNPGESVEGAINVYNEQDVPLRVEVEFGDWIFKKDEPGRVEFMPPGTTPYSCADWIQVDTKEFELSPKESRQVNYIISFPPDAKEGGYYAAIFFVAAVKSPPPEVKRGDRESKMVISQTVRLATLIYNEIIGTPKKVSLVDFEVLQPDKKVVKVIYKMKNEGSGYVKSEGKFHIIDELGNLYGSGVLSIAKMQPGDTAGGEGEWLGELTKGEYDVVMTLELKPFGEEVIVREKRIKIE